MILTDGIELYHASYKVVEKVDPETGYISIFEYKADKASNIKYFEFNSSDTDWLHCVVAHRKSGILKNELEKWQDFDAIAGKIANDSTNQICFRSDNALRNLHFKGYKTVKLED